MPYAGKRMLQREFADFIAPVWQNQEERIKALATAQGESQLYLGAWNDNLGIDGKLKSRDCGAFQINIDDQYVGTEVEANLRTASLDPDEYIPVLKNNIKRARSLYDTPWIRDGEQDKRRWQPWVAYTTGWCMFNQWWVWRHQRNEDGVLVPIGPWVATGRYLMKSISGWANWYLFVSKRKDADESLEWAKRWQAHYKIEGELSVRPKGWIGWSDYPDKPQNPPADGKGPRPVPNNGV